MKAIYLIGQAALALGDKKEYAESLNSCFVGLLNSLVDRINQQNRDHQLVKADLRLPLITAKFIALGKFAQAIGPSQDYFQDAIVFILFKKMKLISTLNPTVKGKKVDVPESHKFLVAAIISVLNDHV